MDEEFLPIRGYSDRSVFSIGLIKQETRETLRSFPRLLLFLSSVISSKFLSLQATRSIVRPTLPRRGLFGRLARTESEYMCFAPETDQLPAWVASAGSSKDYS